MIAKFGGTCSRTGAAYGPGTQIMKGARGWEIVAGGRVVTQPDMRDVQTGSEPAKCMDINKPVICRCVKARPAFAAEYEAMAKSGDASIWADHHMARSGDTLTCSACGATATILPMAAPVRREAEKRTCWECGRSFTYAQCRAADGDWSDNYCGC